MATIALRQIWFVPRKLTFYTCARRDWREAESQSVCSSFCPSVLPFIRYQSREHGILQTNQPILMHIDIIGPRGKDMRQ